MQAHGVSHCCLNIHEISANHWILNLNILCRTWQENAGDGPKLIRDFIITFSLKSNHANPRHQRDTPGFDRSWALQLPKDRTFRGKGSLEFQTAPTLLVKSTVCDDWSPMVQVWNRTLPQAKNIKYIHVFWCIWSNHYSVRLPHPFSIVHAQDPMAEIKVKQAGSFTYYTVLCHWNRLYWNPFCMRFLQKALLDTGAWELCCMSCLNLRPTSTKYGMCPPPWYCCPATAHATTAGAANASCCGCTDQWRASTCAQKGSQISDMGTNLRRSGAPHLQWNQLPWWMNCSAFVHALAAPLQKNTTKKAFSIKTYMLLGYLLELVCAQEKPFWLKVLVPILQNPDKHKESFPVACSRWFPRTSRTSSRCSFGLLKLTNLQSLTTANVEDQQFSKSGLELFDSM